MTIEKQWIEKHQDEFVEDICRLVRIPSVSVETGDPKAPFGPACLKALEASLEIGERFDFQSENHENYCGSLYWQGEDDTEIGIFGHGDVVPAGDGWEYDPFDPQVKDGIIIGRGASDNKGSYMAALYALRYLKESGYKPKHSFRFFIGCNEETGMKDIEYYTENYKEPYFSIVPDVLFPVCNGEKGALRIDAEKKVSSKVLKGFQSGIMSNAVPGNAQAILNITDQEAKKLQSRDCKVEKLGDGTYKINVEGIPAHAAFPEGSENAQVKLGKILLEEGILDEEAKALMEAIKDIFRDYYGQGLDIAFEDDISGKLTHVGGLSSYKDGVFYQNIDIRYNISAHYDLMVENIRKVFEKHGIEAKNIVNSPGTYTDANDPLVKKLVAICNKHLGTDLEAFVMGGGTYTRKLKNAVGFGPGMQGRKKRFGTERGGAHQADEYVEIEDLKKAIEIYIEALKMLDENVGFEKD